MNPATVVRFLVRVRANISQFLAEFVVSALPLVLVLGGGGVVDVVGVVATTVVVRHAVAIVRKKE